MSKIKTGYLEFDSYLEFDKWMGKIEDNFPDIHDHVNVIAKDDTRSAIVMQLYSFCNLDFDNTANTLLSSDLKALYEYMMENKIKYDLWKL